MMDKSMDAELTMIALCNAEDAFDQRRQYRSLAQAWGAYRTNVEDTVREKVKSLTAEEWSAVYAAFDERFAKLAGWHPWKDDDEGVVR